MRYFFDWEFLENGSTIEPISIGIVAEDGRELYLVNEGIEADPLRKRIVGHHWLMQNVVPHLPLRRDRPRDDGFTRLDGRITGFILDHDDNRVVSHRFLRNAVRDFLLADETGPVELWAFYAAYDHVALMQLFGTMTQRPPRLPMRTNDVAQFADMLGIDEMDLPAQDAATLHNALDDARWTRQAWGYLDRIHTYGRALTEGCPIAPVPDAPLFPEEPITVRRGGTPWPVAVDAATVASHLEARPLGDPAPCAPDPHLSAEGLTALPPEEKPCVG